MASSNPLSLFKFNRIIVPILIGLGVGFFMIAHQYKSNTSIFQSMSCLLSGYGLFCLTLALLFFSLREFMYMYRLHLLSDNKLSYKKCFQIIMLWEFGSAITPTSIGGSALALFIIPQEGISAGRSTAIVFVTFILDELFYIIIAPITILLVGYNNAFATHFNFLLFGSKFGEVQIFIIGYLGMMLLTLIVLSALFFSPKGFRRLLIKMGKRRLFNKWQTNLTKMGDDIVTSSQEFKGKSLIYWLKAFFSTVFSWTARFLVLNCLLMAFTPISNQLLLYVRQLVMWIVLCICPTPGGSGVAEFSFPLFLNGFLPQGIESMLALLWRLFTYYPYIIIGVIVLPYWSRRVIKQKKDRKKQN
jgi:uncharacterized protein (TIRG00374 family)